MGFFLGEGIGIDFGSGNTTIYMENEGIVLREPTSVLVKRLEPTTVLAVGSDAHAMLGRTGADALLISPVLDGAVTDADMAALLLVTLAEKATGRRKPMEKAQLLISMSQGVTRVERDALFQAMRLTGAKKAAAVKTPLAAALGAGISVDQPRAVMMVVLGTGTTEIAVVSMCGIVAARSMRSGMFSMDEAIVRYVRRKKGLIIGLRTAEDLKCDIGSAQLPTEDFDETDPDEVYRAFEEDDEAQEDKDGEASEEKTEEEKETEPAGETVLLKGRDAKSGKPRTVDVTTRDIAIALREPVRVLVDAIRDALGRMPDEMAADILETGIYLSGGGALLKGLKELLAEKTGLPVTSSDHPHEDVILGLGRLASDEKLLNAAFEAGSCEE